MNVDFTRPLPLYTLLLTDAKVLVVGGTDVQKQTATQCIVTKHPSVSVSTLHLQAPALQVVLQAPGVFVHQVDAVRDVPTRLLPLFDVVIVLPCDSDAREGLEKVFRDCCPYAQSIYVDVFVNDLQPGEALVLDKRAYFRGAEYVFRAVLSRTPSMSAVIAAVGLLATCVACLYFGDIVQ
jgi:hypothetical protein